MPIYEYVCQKCGKLTDVFQKVNDPAPERCEGCGAEHVLTKVVSRTSFVLKGGGWYSDLYSSAKKESKPESSSGSDSGSSSGSSSSSPSSSSSSSPSSSSTGSSTSNSAAVASK